MGAPAKGRKPWFLITIGGEGGVSTRSVAATQAATKPVRDARKARIGDFLV
jgi:hypothetical protein